LPRLASNLDPPISASQIVEVTGQAKVFIRGKEEEHFGIRNCSVQRIQQ
jgi:hypothetical protein